MPEQLQVRSSAGTHTGHVRSRNEDRYLARDDAGLWVVADGMGGHSHGEWAAATTVAALSVVEGGAAAVPGAIAAANATIWQDAVRQMTQMGSTVVALCRDGDRMDVAWVGDSRAYRLRGGVLDQLSRDHSQVQQLVDAGMVAAADARGHPMGHILTRAVGVRETVDVETASDTIRPGDRYLLCSDGLSNTAEPALIASLAAIDDPDLAIRRLIEAALDAGAPDNVTVLLVVVAGDDGRAWA